MCANIIGKAKQAAADICVRHDCSFSGISMLDWGSAKVQAIELGVASNCVCDNKVMKRLVLSDY